MTKLITCDDTTRLLHIARELQKRDGAPEEMFDTYAKHVMDMKLEADRRASEVYPQPENVALRQTPERIRLINQATDMQKMDTGPKKPLEHYMNIIVNMEVDAMMEREVERHPLWVRYSGANQVERDRMDDSVCGPEWGRSRRNYGHGND